MTAGYPFHWRRSLLAFARRVPSACRLIDRDDPPGRRGGAVVLGLLILLGSSGRLEAQYFGRNKVHYHSFDFRVLRAQHFDMYFYPAESAATADAARMAEAWYGLHAKTMRDTFARKPIVFYADAPDFQETNVIGGFLGQGTGGVTEGARNRVVLWFAGPYAETNHVLGHELVHVFQYDIAEKPTSEGGGGGIRAMSRTPLWMVEGLAEYLTIGRNDAHTAMWLREAMLRNDLPTLKQLEGDSRFFPYRYGEALWAYIGARWGEDTVPMLFRSALVSGVERSVKRVLGLTPAELSTQWHAAIRDAYGPLVVGRAKPEDVGTRLLPAVAKSRDFDVAPAVSPDGRYVAFITQRGLFQIDLYVADAQTGKIIHRLTGPNTDPEFDELSFIGSAGAWSPDGKRLAYPVFAGGRIGIAIFDVASGRVERRIRVPGIDAVNDIAWGPDEQLAVSGTSGGLSDLALYSLTTGTTTQLRHGRYAALQPAWAPDGRSIAFVTDSGPGTDMEQLRFSRMRIAVLDVATRATRLLALFARAKHINPQYSPDGQTLYFIADPDGFPDIYSTSLASGDIARVTHVVTGISGITALSPALSVARVTGRLVFSVYAGGGYTLEQLDASQAKAREAMVSATAADTTPRAAMLSLGGGSGAVTPSGGTGASQLQPSAQSTFPVVPYRPRFALDYIGTEGVGFAFGPGGSGASGGVAASVSDLLGNHVIGAQITGAGELEAFGGQLTYLNQGHRWNWGVGLSYTPYLSEDGLVIDTVVTGPSGPVQAFNVEEDRLRTSYVQANLFAQYPLSTTRRLEFSAGYSRVNYSLSGTRSLVVDGVTIDKQTIHPPSLPGLNLGQVGGAYVGDFSTFGLVSPIAGGRYRFEVDPSFGPLTYATAQLDYRRYLYMKPITFAFRGFHSGRYGPDGDDPRLGVLNVGDPSLVRGYDVNSFKPSECASSITGIVGSCPAIDRLLGSKIATVSAELRIPILGAPPLGFVRFPYAPLELAPFVDGGVAWTGSEAPHLEFSTTSGARIPVFSSGLSARVNMLGYAVVEGYYAYAFQRPGRHSQFGFQIAPGW